MKVVQLVEDSRYIPVKDIQIGGIVMVKHIQIGKEEELVEPVAGKMRIANFLLNKYYLENIILEIYR